MVSTKSLPKGSRPTSCKPTQMGYCQISCFGVWSSEFYMLLSESLFPICSSSLFVLFIFAFIYLFKLYTIGVLQPYSAIISSIGDKAHCVKHAGGSVVTSAKQQLRYLMSISTLTSVIHIPVKRQRRSLLASVASQFHRSALLLYFVITLGNSIFVCLLSRSIL